MATAENAAVLGLFLLPVGLLNWRYAETIATIDEKIDAIGSSRSWASVRAAEWKIALTRYLGMGLTVASTLGILWWLTTVLLG